jgi:hypothetical protein
MSIQISKVRGTKLQINPKIVKDQLQLYYDVNNINSYVSGTALTNMAPSAFSNGVNGTLDNSSMVQTPANVHPYIQIETDNSSALRRISLSSTITFDTDDDARTMTVWFWSDYNGTGQYANSHALFGGKYVNYWAIKNNGVTTYQTEAETNGGTVGNHDYFSYEHSLVFGGWNNWTVVWNGTTAQNYINGSNIGSSYTMNDESVFSYDKIGSTSTGTGSSNRGGTWRFGGLLIYNKALSLAELNQNHKVFQSKFNRVSSADVTIPVITLVGANPQSIELGTAYSELGATATDNIDGNITGDIVIDATAVNVNIAGDYTITYNVSDTATNNATQVTRTVTITADVTVPVITLTGADVSQTVGGSYSDAGATAADNIDGIITNNIVVAGQTVDPSTVGVYTVTYNVQDTAGNNAVEVTRTVTITAVASSGISIPADSDLSGALTNASTPFSVIGGGIGYVFRMRGSSTNSTGAWNTYGSNWESGLVNSSTFSSNFGTLFLPSVQGNIDGVNFGQAIENIVGEVTLGNNGQLVEMPTAFIMEIAHDNADPQWYVKFKIHSVGAFHSNTANVRLNSIPYNTALRTLIMGGSSTNDFDIDSSDFISGAGSIVSPLYGDGNQYGEPITVKIKAV